MATPPYLWLDATYLKVRQDGRIVSVAATIATALNTDGRREVLGMAVGASEAQTFWTEFLRSLPCVAIPPASPLEPWATPPAEAFVASSWSSPMRTKA